LKGKRAYLAPEQLRGLPIDRRLDVYAASVVLWEMLTGHRLFAADSELDVLGQILGARVEPPSRYAPNIPPELDALVLRGLQRYPCHRFATALEMATALERTVRVPTAREVGEWVVSVARDSLAARSAILRRIETGEPETRLASGVYSVPPPPAAAPPISTTGPATLVDAAPPSTVQAQQHRRLLHLLLPLKLLLVAALVFGAVRGHTVSHPTVSESAR
jgi:serine/threonine-protein kinase